MAVTDCIEKNAHLASIHSKPEHDFLWKLASKKRVWIGAKLIGTSIQWLDGTTFDFKYWSRGQPDNAGRREHCIEILTSGQWNDFPCENKFPYVCKKDMPGTFIKTRENISYILSIDHCKIYLLD